MPVSWREIDFKKLCSYKSGRVPVISFYLHTQPPINIKTAAHSLIAQKKKYLKKRDWPEITKKSVLANLEKIHSYVGNLVSTDEMRSVVIFAGINLWEVYRLPTVVQSKCYIDPYPYIRDLSSALDRFKKYGLVFVDRNNARFFNFYLGQVDETLDFVREYLPQEVRGVGRYSGREKEPVRGMGRLTRNSKGMTGFSKGYVSEKVARHIEWHLDEFLKKISQKTSRLTKEKDLDKLLVSGRQEVMEVFIPHLHPYIQQKILGKFTIDFKKKKSMSDLLARCAKVVEKYESREEQQLIDDLNEQCRPGGKGVMGIYETANALMLGEVRTLFLKDDFSGFGYICFKDNFCRALAGECEICGDPLIRVADLGNEMIRIALGQRAEVKNIFYPHKVFDKHQVGALLRFST